MMLSCHAAGGVFVDLFAGELSEEYRGLVEEPLAGGPPCRALAGDHAAGGPSSFMGDRDILRTLAGYPFARDLAREQLRALAGGAGPFTLRPGELLAGEGEAALAFYLICDGYVRLSTDAGPGGRVLVQTVGPGEVVGWSWLIPPHRWVVEVRAEGAVRGFAYDAGWLRDLCRRDPAIGYALARYLVGVFTRRLASSRRAEAGCDW
jgi:CRP-like cAMP-binding protein